MARSPTPPVLVVVGLGQSPVSTTRSPIRPATPRHAQMTPKGPCGWPSRYQTVAEPVARSRPSGYLLQTGPYGIMGSPNADMAPDVGRHDSAVRERTDDLVQKMSEMCWELVSRRRSNHPVDFLLPVRIPPLCGIGSFRVNPHSSERWYRRTPGRGPNHQSSRYLGCAEQPARCLYSPTLYQVWSRFVD